MAYSGWALSPETRNHLLELFPPIYENVIAHHITLQFPVRFDANPPPDVTAEIVGYADDGEGLQALVFAINGETLRPDGKTYHCTWSLAEGRKPKESNDVLENGYALFDKPVMVNVIPKVFA